MSTNFMIKDDHITADELNFIFNIKSSTLSERIISSPIPISRKVCSEINIESNVNYDDLCGPWVYSKNPIYDRYIIQSSPKVCIWNYLTEQDIVYLKKCQRSEGMFFFEKLFLSKYEEKCNRILVKVLWEFFKFVRYSLLYSFTEKSVSVVLGVVHLTHLFFLSNPRCTAEEVFQFFHESILLHAVLNPPNSIEVLSIAECKHVFKVFHEVFLENLVLLHISCHEIYHFTISLDNSLSWIEENQL